MKTKILFLLIALTALFAAPIPALADGVIIPEPPVCLDCPVPPPPPRETPYLTVQNHHVTVTIDRQVATTRVEQVFRNDSQWSLEGTYIFPLPENAAINQFSMWVDGQKVEGQLYTKNEARRIYNDIVRRRLDPALLEYIGRDLFQASIFPIDPGDTRKVVIEYSQILPADGGLVKYVYPLSTEKFSANPLEDVSVTVKIRSDDPIKAVYSPSHPVSIDRPDDYRATVGWEARDVRPNTDFALYYSVSPQDLGLNLLSYKTGDEDGFFTMLIAPSIRADEIVDKDVVLVLDTSGSMEGEKMAQAQDALNFVLNHLNPNDRFNIVAFSTGVRAFSNGLEPVSAVPDAERFVENLRAEGSTDINRALLEAMASLPDDSARPAIIIFLTDGLPTSGVTEPDQILAGITQAAPKNVRIFPFGVGDDVDTFLLDSLARELRGASAYVRPGERVDEAVSGFYAKVSTPVLADVELLVDGVTIADTYPYPLPDIFAGTQLVVTGRYPRGGAATVTLKGTVNGRTQEFRYDDLTFARDGGAEFIPRLWATRKIGYLLNQIRLHGENAEAIDQIVKLSIRYGIITPYTSFLVEEPADALTESGRDVIIQQEADAAMSAAPAPSSGAAAVEKAVESTALENADMAAPMEMPMAVEGSPGVSQMPAVTTVGEKAFILRDGVWTDTTFDPEKMTARPLAFASDEMLQLLADNPAAAKYFALGDSVIVVLNGTAYQTTPPDADTVAISNTLPTATPIPPEQTGGVPENPAVPDDVQPDLQAEQPVVISLEGVPVWALVAGGLAAAGLAVGFVMMGYYLAKAMMGNREA